MRRRAQDSVQLGLDALDTDTEICAIHDAARPSSHRNNSNHRRGRRPGGCHRGHSVVDTILMDDGDGFLRETPDRRLLWACQTPQTFRAEIIRGAHAEAVRRGFRGTDDATLVRHCGHPVKLVPGSTENLKVTRPADLHVAETFIRKGIGCV